MADAVFASLGLTGKNQHGLVPSLPVGKMSDVPFDFPNMTTNIDYTDLGPVAVDPGTSQGPITSKLRMVSLRDATPTLYKRSAPLFHYAGRDAATGVRGRHVALALQNMNEYLALTAQRELMRFGQLADAAEPEWSQQLYDLLYSPCKYLMPLGAMWSNDEPKQILQREITTNHAGPMTLVPNYWGIQRETGDYVGFAIKRVKKTFLLKANGDVDKLFDGVQVAFGDANVYVENYVPQIVPIIEDGNAGPLYWNGDPNDVAKPGTDRWNRELVYEAPRLYQRAMSLNAAGTGENHRMAVEEFVREHGGRTVRAGFENDHSTPPGVDSDYEPMATHVAPYFRFGQVTLIEKPLHTAVRIGGADPSTLLEKAMCSFDDETQLQKTSHLLISLSRNQSCSWRK